MQRALVVLAILAAGITGSSGLAGAGLPRRPVPAAVETQIAKSAGLESYTPARMLTNWHYDRWQYVPGELRVWFSNRSHWQITFDATPLRTVSCSAGAQKTFQLGGVTVYWSQVTDPTVQYVQQAWRCVKHPSGRWIRLSATSTRPPSRLADTGVGQVAAFGRLIRR
jgi:hypothetical protein